MEALSELDDVERREAERRKVARANAEIDIMNQGVEELRRERVAEVAEAGARVAATTVSPEAESMNSAIGSCMESADLHDCDRLPAEGDRQECKRQCQEHGEQQTATNLKAAVLACADRFADSAGRERKCVFEESNHWKPKDGGKACSAACATYGEKLRRYSQTHELCCDGTRSPTCTYGTHRPGCCSRHRGVCTEEPPKP